MRHGVDDAFALPDGMDDPNWFGRLDSLTLFQVEDGVVSEQNRLAIFRFSCFLVLLSVFIDLPEDNLGTVLAFLNASAQALGLTIGNPVARAVTQRSEKENIDASLFLLADKVCWRLGTPVFTPRRHP